MIVGTAGHVDHGKTTLVRALTGVDTDRLPEEKARGISIELGYAYAPLADGQVLGFVDVPGHERFVHTMLAGATGIEFALLVVAADDGVMAQTREHLNILALLGVETGAVALTKTDAVDAARVAEVRNELHKLVTPTPLANAPIFAVSGRTGEGVDALRAHLEACALGQRGQGDDDKHFRLAVDRSFTLPGFGTIVTGTVHSGEVRTGAAMVVAPSGRPVRVRGIHAQNREALRGSRGERCALNLAGVAKDEVMRGHWIVAPPILLTTSRVDARLALNAGEERPLRSGATVHVHLGAAHAAGRVVVLEGSADGEGRHDEIAPGMSRLVQLVLQTPIAAWNGDRFIVRDPGASSTIGGGRVLDPFAPPRYRRSAERRAMLVALEGASASACLAALIERAPFGIDLTRFARGGNVREPERLLASTSARRIVRDGADFAVGDRQWRALQAQAEEALGKFHREHPDELGPDGARLKRIAFPRLDPALYRALVADLIAQGRFRQGGPWLHLPGHDNAPSPQERTLLEKVLPRLLDARFDPPWVRDLAKEVAQPEAMVRGALIRASKRGETYQVVRDLFYHPAAICDLAVLANRLQHADGEVRAASFRDRTGLGRKRAIQILEFFDRVGFTRRVQDKHIVRTDHLLALGGSPVTADGTTRQGAIDAHRSN